MSSWNMLLWLWCLIVINSCIDSFSLVALFACNSGKFKVLKIVICWWTLISIKHSMFKVCGSENNYLFQFKLWRVPSTDTETGVWERFWLGRSGWAANLHPRWVPGVWNEEARRNTEIDSPRGGRLLFITQVCSNGMSLYVFLLCTVKLSCYLGSVCAFVLPLSDSIEVVLVAPFLNHITSHFTKSREKESMELYQANSLMDQCHACILLFRDWGVHIRLGVQGENIKISMRFEVLDCECEDCSLVECNAMYFCR